MSSIWVKSIKIRACKWLKGMGSGLVAGDHTNVFVEKKRKANRNSEGTSIT
jgi:hypothetical protein